MDIDIHHLRTWVGRTETTEDLVTQVPLQALAATLDREATHLNTVPPCWHWLYFLPLYRQSAIGIDGHPKRGGFLPPVPLPRRMWAGSQITFHAPMRVGQHISRTSRIADVRLKEGKTGPLVFVNVDHELRVEGQQAITERHDIVYRDMPALGAPPAPGIPTPEDAKWSRTIEPSDVLLFRYSALTFNGHRIHYDRRYVTEVEGYPGLVVHGPLIATLLLDLLRHNLPDAQVAGFSFRAVRPLFDTAPFTIFGELKNPDTVMLWARTPDGFLAMDATATLR